MKPSTAKAKGRATESAFVAYLSRWVPHVERRRLAGVHDRGDITGMPGWVWEVKSGARVDIAGWLAELDAEITNDRADLGAVVVRPKSAPNPEQWYTVMPLPAFMRLLEQAGWVPAPHHRDIAGETIEGAA